MQDPWGTEVVVLLIESPSDPHSIMDVMDPVQRLFITSFLNNTGIFHFFLNPVVIGVLP